MNEKEWGLRPAGFIDPSTFQEKRTTTPELSMSMRERAAAMLSVSMEKRSGRMNATIREMIPALGDVDLLDPEGRVDMFAFSRENGGPYERERIEREHHAATILHDGLSRNYKESLQRYYGGDAKKAAEEGERKRRLRPGEIGEGALFCVLNRVMGKRFLVVRTARPDDEGRSVDFMIVDLEKGGRPVCAIDEFIGDEELADSETKSRIEKKKARLNRRGGMSLRYGIEAKDGTLVLGEYEGLPGVYAAAGHKELKVLIESGADLASDDGEPSQAEWDFFARIVGSMKDYVDHVGLSSDSPVYEFLRAAEERLSTGTVIGQEKT